jgi:hypothetical protein
MDREDIVDYSWDLSGEQLIWSLPAGHSFESYPVSMSTAEDMGDVGSTGYPLDPYVVARIFPNTKGSILSSR